MSRCILPVACAISLVLGACSDSSSGTNDEPASFPEEVSNDGEEGGEYEPFAAGKADVEFSSGPLKFTRACESGDTLTIAAVGDVLLHGRLQKQAYGNPARFISLWSNVRDLLEQADVTYANLEGPTARGVNAGGHDVPDPGLTFDGVVYTSYPAFNYHPLLVEDLVLTGVDVVSTANNHSLDRRSLGVDRSIDALETRNLPFTGTHRQGDATGPWYVVTEHKGFKLAWLACTYATNGIPDSANQVLGCYRHQDKVEATVRELAGRSDIDAVLVTPHWGLEYHATPENKEIHLAHSLLDAGASAIIGSHPHVLQPWEKYVTADGRETFAIYSLGNFVSGQRDLPRRSTLLLYLGLTRFGDGSVGINGVRYVPIHVDSRDGMILAEAIDRVGGFADSRDLTVGMFGDWNVLPPEAELITNPHCDPSWTPPDPPHPHDFWIGGSCTTSEQCGGVTCMETMPGGLCTQPCESTCPDRTGHPVTLCVDLGVAGTGHCVAQCDYDSDCREGYTCELTSRYGDSTTTRKVCIPAA